MPNVHKVVVLISREVIRAASVEDGKIVDPIEMEWQQDLLRKAFSVIKTRYHMPTIRLVLDDDLSHTLDVDIPGDTDLHEVKDVIEAKLKVKYPEISSTDDWDYKVKETKDDLKVVTVFIPVQDVYLSITDAAAKEGLNIEAVEPLAITLSRNENPFLGMAEKSDLRGDDEEVLNLQPLYKVEKASGSLESAETVKTGKGLNKVFIYVAALLLFGLLAYGVLSAVKKGSNNAAPSPSPSVAAFVEPSPTPTPAPVELDTLKINILNGSGVPGQAGAVSALLEKAGFSKGDAGNADNYDFTDTIVSIKSSVPESAYLAIVKALQPDYTVKKGTALSSSSEYDVVVTVGVKASSTSTAKPTAKSSATPKPSVVPSVSPKASTSPSPSSSASPSPSSSVKPSTSPSN